jgi:hypothetical protein
MAYLHAIAEHGEPDESTPYERGLMFGEAIAECIGRGEMAGDFGALAADPPRVPAFLRSRIMNEWGMGERLAASEYCDADGAFWQGFVQGVRGYIKKVREQSSVGRSAPPM